MSKENQLPKNQLRVAGYDFQVLIFRFKAFYDRIPHLFH
jgi:hypothetical protein